MLLDQQLLTAGSLHTEVKVKANVPRGLSMLNQVVVRRRNFGEQAVHPSSPSPTNQQIMISLCALG